MKAPYFARNRMASCWNSRRTAVAIQENLGSGHRHVPGRMPTTNADAETLQRPVGRPVGFLWARRCRDAHKWPDQALLASCKGGLDLDLRRHFVPKSWRARFFPDMPWVAFSVGESPD